MTVAVGAVRATCHRDGRFLGPDRAQPAVGRLPGFGERHAVVLSRAFCAAVVCWGWRRDRQDRDAEGQQTTVVGVLAGE